MIHVFGPCSAESREQVLETAREIAIHFPNAIFRAGIWKPRTRPNHFEGVGKEGLEWLKDVRDETGLKIATEVANARHVEDCREYNFDVLWLGARTTVNPFYVQEIAVALKGFKGRVFVKNPVVPDLNLWIGAIERIEQAGIESVAAVHRGFHHFDTKPYRNKPQWEIPIGLMAKRPDIPVICDISHICGLPDLFKTVAQKALDLSMAGLHIETHLNPLNALSDAQQQITPQQLVDLLNELEVRRSSVDNPDFRMRLETLRNEIDNIDENLLRDLNKRMETVRSIGELKKDNGVTILQMSRWKNIVERYMSEGKTLGLSEHFLRDLLNAMHDEAMRKQNEVMNE